MIGAEGLKSESLDHCFERMMVVAGGGGGYGGGMKMGGGGVITEWKDIPMELLLRIVSLVDDRTVVVASGVCSGWRDAICWGLTNLSLSWCKNNMNNLVLSLAPKFTKLRVLVLRQDKSQLQDNAVETIANCCHELQDLDLSKSFKLTDRCLYALAHGCPNLTKLNISGCSAFSDTSLSYLSKFCRKLKILNLCGCVKAASDTALKDIGYNCNQLQYLNLGWCENVGDIGVMSLAYGCPDLRVLDLCGCVLITDASVIALANYCLHLRSLGLYYCQNITDTAMYALAHSRVKNKHEVWESVRNRFEEEGLRNLNISQCTALTPPAVQALCDSFPALHMPRKAFTDHKWLFELNICALCLWCSSASYGQHSFPSCSLSEFRGKSLKFMKRGGVVWLPRGMGADYVHSNKFVFKTEQCDGCEHQPYYYVDFYMLINVFQQAEDLV